jgi:hypothetical protein
MSGVIEEIPLPDLLQLLSTSRKSGVLSINSSGGVGKIYLRKGQIYFAAINDDFALSPQKAIYRMLTWATGTFELEPSVEIQVMEEIQESTEALLMEGVRQLDEINNVAHLLPPPGSRWRCRRRSPAAARPVPGRARHVPARARSRAAAEGARSLPGHRPRLREHAGHADEARVRRRPVIQRGSFAKTLVFPERVFRKDPPPQDVGPPPETRERSAEGAGDHGRPTRNARAFSGGRGRPRTAHPKRESVQRGGARAHSRGPHPNASGSATATARGPRRRG